MKSLYEELHGCRRKKYYLTKKDANKYKRRYEKQFNCIMRVYECTICGNFHLATEKKDES